MYFACMNNLNVKLHKIQLKLLKQLALEKGLNFNSLIIYGLESEHMNYHLKRLVEFNLVEKIKNNYVLTDEGKDFSNLLDDDVDQVEKQPKTSILLHAVRKNNGVIEHLYSKRLRQPYYGKVGRLTGKVRFGETLLGAAQRELYEEAGLKAKTWHLEEIYQKLRRNKHGKFLQDNLFYVFFVTDFYGTFISKTEFQENVWITNDDIENKKYDFYSEVKLSNRLKPKNFSFTEDIDITNEY